MNVHKQIHSPNQKCVCFFRSLMHCEHVRRTTAAAQLPKQHTNPLHKCTHTQCTLACLNSNSSSYDNDGNGSIDSEFTTARILSHRMNSMSHCNRSYRFTSRSIWISLSRTHNVSDLHSVIKQYQWTVSHWQRNKSRVFSPVLRFVHENQFVESVFF